MSDNANFAEADCINLKAFLATNTGQKLIPYLKSLRPSISAKEHISSPQPMEAAALAGYRAAGWEDCAETLEAIANSAKPNPALSDSAEIETI